MAENGGIKSSTAYNFKNEDLYADQYIIVREIEQHYDEFTTQQRILKQIQNGIVDGSATYLNAVNNQAVNYKDPEVFMRHADIKEVFRIKIDFLRDFKNCLKLLSDSDYFSYVEQLESDVTRMQIARMPTTRFNENPHCSEELQREQPKIRDQRIIGAVGGLPKLSPSELLDEFDF